MDNDAVEALQDKSTDFWHTATAASLNLAPYCGGALAEIFNFFVKSPAEKRLKKFIIALESRISVLENKEILKNSESFQSVILQAIPVAIRHHQTEKREALLNIIVHAAANVDVDEDLNYIFINYIDELTLSHLVLMRFIENYLTQISNIESYEELFSRFNLETNDTLSYDTLKLFCDGLVTRNLVRFSSELKDKSGIKEGGSFMLLEGLADESPMIRITDIGRQFVKFICSSI